MEISDQQFENLIARAMDELPEKYIKNLSNVVVTYADDPTDEQRIKMKLREDQTLFGLYEGIPLTARGAGYNLVLPDKITIFKLPIVRSSYDDISLFRQVKHTLWHEIAHFYGLDHDKIDEIEARWQSGQAHA